MPAIGDGLSVFDPSACWAVQVRTAGGTWSSCHRSAYVEREDARARAARLSSLHPDRVFCVFPLTEEGLRGLGDRMRGLVPRVGL